MGNWTKKKKRNEKNYEMNLEKCVTQRCFNNFNIRNFWNFPFLYFSFRSCYLYFKFFYINNIVRYIMYFNTQQFFFYFLVWVTPMPSTILDLYTDSNIYYEK